MTQSPQLHATEKMSSRWTQAVGLGVIVLLIAGGVWTSVQLSPFLPETFNRLSAALVSITQTFIPGELLIVEAEPLNASSGEAVRLSWTHRNQRGDGIYSLSYPCQENVYIVVEVTSGDKTLLCDILSDIYSEDRVLALKIFSENPEAKEIPLTLSYTKVSDDEPSLKSVVILSVSETTEAAIGDTGAKETVTTAGNRLKTDEKKDTVKTAQSKASTSGQRTEKTYTVSKENTSSTPFGKADLAPKILEIGTIDTISNEFKATTTLRVSDRIAVRFEVENLGTADSGHWQFSAVLPTFPMHIFESEGQQSLAPGDRIEYTIGFDNVEPDIDGQFVINVDPTSSISEASESNNLATTTIRSNSK